MKAEPDPAQLRLMQIVSGVMLAAALVFLGIAHWVHGNHPGSLEVMAYVAIAVAVAAPIEVAFVDKRKAPGDPVAHHIITFGILEAAALFCGGALMTATNDWPLLAAVIPLGMMILRFPRAS